MDAIAEILSYAELVGGVQGIFLLVLLLRQPGPKAPATYLLAALLLAASVVLFWAALHDSRFLAHVPDAMVLGPGWTLLFGPLLYLYVRAVIEPGFTWKPGYFLHLLPFLLFQATAVPFVLKSYAEKKAFVLNHYVHHPGLDLWGQLPLVQFFLYMIPVIRLVNRHHRAIKGCYSAIERLKLTWLCRLILGLALLWAAFTVLNLLVDLQVAGSLFSLLLACLVYYTGYKGIRQPGLFRKHEAGTGEVAGPAAGPDGQAGWTVKRKYEKSELPEEKMQALAARLTDCMETDQLYRQSQLTLTDLAARLEVSPHHLSQVFTQFMGTTFYDFVNRYRVEAVKAALLDPRRQHLTILALALDAGFESKATFNTVFKKHVGLTPSQYRKEMMTQANGRDQDGSA